MDYEPSEPEPPDLKEIERAVRVRLEFLRPLVEEHDRLAAAEAALEKALTKL